MLRFHVQNFIRALNGIRVLEEVVSRKEGQDLLFAKIVSEAITDLQPMTKLAGLDMTTKAVERLNAELSRDSINPRIVKDTIADIRRRMDDELANAVFFTLTKNKDKIAPEQPLFGNIVALSFPSTLFDIEEAGKCLALGRSTASVFHLMRVLEVALLSLAQELKVSVSTENWNTVLISIENEIRSRRSKGQNAVWSQDDETFFADAMTSFFAFKNAWRNHTMHKRVIYTEEKASDIYEAVRAFMKHIGERVRESDSILS